MNILLIAYCIFAAIMVVGLLCAIVVGWLYFGRQSRRDAELSEHYLRLIINMLISEDHETLSFPMLRHSGARLVLAETIARLTGATYGLELSHLRKIALDAGLYGYLVRRVRRTRGYRRGWFLSLLSRMPANAEAVREAVRHTSDSNRSVRFYALMVRLSGDPSQALRLMAEYADPFTPFEQAEVMAMLRRGMLPIAYEPLIASPVRNLRSMGLSIVRQFGVEEAEKQLLRIVAFDDQPELALEALYALCAMRLSLCRRAVMQRVALISSAERKSLLRYMALEGYAVRGLEVVLGRDETPYFEALTYSYKRSLVCM